MFICATVLSFAGATFSKAVSMSVACLSTFGKMFCTVILILGRLELFALFIAIAGIKFRRKKSNW